ncbi:MAG: FHA domain-containing protein [Nitrospirae bacterium]|nr:FHA domain-containing protein [Nitrospirota bacterium]
MTKEIFPEGQVIFKNKSYTDEFFSITMDEIDKAGESFMGILKADEPDAAYFLFFLKGDAYAAGCIKNDKPMPISIKDFMQRISTETSERTLSLHKTDPVLFKGMLVFLQRDPSTKVTTDMINLDSFLNQIKSEQAAAFVILKRNNTYNFFYFHSGEPEMAHFADASHAGITDSPIAEQMLLYAYPADKTPVEVLVYRDIKTSEASDTADVKQFLIADALMHESRSLGTTQADVAPPAAEAEKEEKALRVRIEVTDGPQKGNKFNVPLPCTIGRRDATIRIRDMTISKTHASIEVSEGKIIFRDLDSTNGSIVNGKAVKEIELSSGSTVQMGNTTLKIHFVTS